MAKRNILNWNNIAGYSEYGDSFETEADKRLKRRRQQLALDKQRENASLGKKILGTAVDVTGNILLGGYSAAEGVSDWARYRGADILDFFGADNKAEKIRERARQNDTEDIATSFKHIVQGDFNRSKTDEEINRNDFVTKNSLIDEDTTWLGANSRGVLQGIGNTLGYATMTGMLGGATAGINTAAKGGKALKAVGDLAPIYLSAAGGGQTEAYNEGANNKQAAIYGTLSGGVEAISESLFGGLGEVANKLGISSSLGLGKGALDDQLINGLTSRFKSTLAKNLVDLGMRSAGEGFEEVFSGLNDAFLKKMTYMSDKELKDLITDQNLMESFVSGALSSFLTQAPTNVKATIQGKEAATGITKNENKVIEAEVEERTKGKELSKKEINEIRKEVREDLQNGYISTDMIEKTLGEDYDRSKDIYLQESYNERARRQTSFNTDLSQYKNENQRNIVQKAIDSGILNDSKKTHNFVDLVSKIAADKGMDFVFVNNQKIAESGFAVEGKTVNGYVNGNTIGLNIESNNALNKTVGHEITHILEGSDLYQALQDSLKNYVGEDTWNKRIKELSETYKNVENADVTKELTADLVGENLFNNEDFVRSLSTKNMNLFEKIFNEIKYMVKIATAGSKEKRELVKLQKVFQEAYRDSKTTKKGTQYSIQGLENYTEQEIKDISNNYIQNILSQNGIDDVEIVDSAIHGSRGRGTARDDSDLDLVVQYKGDIREDDLFNALNDNGEDNLYIDGIRVDINPIQEDLSSYMERSNQYDNEIRKTNDLNEYVADAAVREAQQRESEKQAIREAIQEHLDEESITNPTREDMLNAFDTYDLMDASDEFNDYQKAEKLISDVVDEMLKERTRYSLTDNEVDNTSFSLEQRVSGDKLLDAQDLIQDIKEAGAEVDDNGYVTVYHQTTNENAQKIRESGEMYSNEPYVYFSTSKDAQQSQGRGETKLEFKIPAEDLILDDLFSDNADVKIALNGKKTLDISNYLVNNDTKYSLTNAELKQKQNDIIQQNNPLDTSLGEHTWINSADDIKTYQEALDYDEYENGNLTPDFTESMVKKALDTGKITVYSSYPIKQGTFVTPSKMEAQSYAGNSQVYSKEVNLNDVAWIDSLQGQYANTESGVKYSLSVQEANTTQDNEGRKLTDNQLAYFKDSKAVDENGNLVTVYHTMTNTGNQFFEFNPVGTDFYRFGDQVVNYFTDNQDMSGSYADSNYKRAYTKPIKSMEDVQNFIKFQNTQSDGNIGVNGITNHYEIEKTDEGYKLTQKPNGREFLEFPINDEETKVALERVKANETLHRDFLGSSDPVATIKNQLERWYDTRQYDGYPKLAQLLDIYNRETTKLIAERNTQAEQSVLQTIFKNDLEGFLFGERQFSDEKVNDVINRGLTKRYNNEQDLIDNIQNDFQAKYQYAGYINMTNPYVIDTFGENWDSVTTERNEAKNNEYNRVIKDNETKEKLYNLAQESERLFKEYSQSNKPREFAEYSIIKNKINNSELREVVNDMGMFGLTYEGWLEAGKKNAELFGEEYKQTLPNSDEKITNYTESLNPAELELVQDLTIGEFVNRYGELYKENMKFGDSSSYFKDQFRATTGTTLDTDKIGYSNMFDLARYNFDGSSVSEFLDEKLTTNDLVKRIIEKNNSGETNYDGLIMKNVYDYGGKSNKSFKTTGDLYVTFNSNQFKAVDNLNPTDDADIRYQLGTNEIAPTRGWDVRGRDIALESAIAPLQEQVQQLQNTIEDLRDNIAPLREEDAENLPINEDIEAPTRYNLTPEESQELDELENLDNKVGLTDEEQARYDELREKEENTPAGEDMTPIESLNDVRDIEDVGDRKVKAYQYEHPEVKPYFQEEARNMLRDLNNSTKGERYAIPGQSQNINDWEWIGLKRQTSPEIEMLLDGDLGASYTYDEIRKGLNAIIEDHGAENIAVAKRIEFLLDERLRNGYDEWDVMDENYEPYHVEPNQDYLNMLREQSWEKYYEQSPWLENAPAEIEEPVIMMTPEEVSRTDNIAPTREITEMVDNEINRKSTTNNQPRQIRQERSAIRRFRDTFEGAFINRNVHQDNLARETGNRAIKHKADMLSNVMGEVGYDINDYQTNNQGQAIGKGIKGLFEEANSQGLGEAFNDFLINYSNIDRYKQGKGSQTPLEVSKRLVRDYAIQYPQFKKWAKDVWNWSKNERQNLVDAGLIDQELADNLERIYPHYVPYVSDYENADVYFEGVGELKPKGIKRAKGGAGKLLSVQDAMARYTYAQKNAVRTNELYSEIVDTLGTIPNFGIDERTDYTDMKDTLYKDSRGQYLTAYRDGRQITTQINAELYNELSKNFENQVKNFEKNMELVLKPIQKINEIRRNILTTWSPTFPVTNAIKDIQDALLNSKHTMDMVKNYPSAIKELATMKTDQVKQFVALYGSGFTMGEFGQDTMNQNTKNIKFLNKIRQANEIIELAPRYAEFKASLQNGESLQEAMYNAREVTTNFGRGGVITKALNRNGATFLNASVQGFDKLIRNFSGENGAKGVVNSLIKVAALGVAPALFNHLVFGGDDDEEYEALPDYIKDNYYLIKLNDDGDFLRIPKGRMLSVFGSAARRTLEATEGRENAFNGWLENAWNQTGVNNPADNNLFAPVLQAYGSKNGTAWYGGDIIPTRLQDKPAEDQYDESTDKFSIWLGQKLGISPYKLNYVIDQYTGGLGDIVLPTITEEATSDGNLLAPIKDKFVTNSTTKNKYVSDFYSKREEITKKANGSKATDEDKLQQKYLDDISWEMSALYKEKREIQNNSDLTKKEKFERSQEIKKEINRLAKEGLDNYKNVSQTGSYSEVNGNEYQKTTDGWKKVKDEESTEINSYGLDSNERNTYFKTKSNISNIKTEYKDSKDYAGKKSSIINEIRSSNLPDDAKIGLYQDTYNDKKAQYYVDAGIKADDYLDFKSQTFTADKDKNGKSISGSKKKKVFDYINSMNIPFEQKIMLVKTEYPSYNEYNRQIINYVNNSGLDYEEVSELLKDMGFEVNGNNVTW